MMKPGVPKLSFDAKKFYRRFSVALFGDIYEKYSSEFEQLKPNLMSINIEMPVKALVCMMFMTTVLIFFASMASIFVFSVAIALEAVIVVILTIFTPILAAAFTFFAFYMYPIQKASGMKNSIETDLPFALANMNAIASSGIPPEFMFDMLTDYQEYGAISEQAKLIVRNIRTFGMSSTKSIYEVAKRTP